MTRRILPAALFAALLSAPAFAGGMAEPAPMPPVSLPPAAPASDWTGLYGGVQLEYFGNGEDRGFGFDADFDGTLAGIFAGYRYDFGSIVAGFEIDYLLGSGEQTPITGPAVGQVNDVDYTLRRVGVELGYDAGPALIYAGIGHAHLGFDFVLGDFEDPGHYFGLGMDYRVTDSITVGAEINRNVFNDFAADNNDLTFTTVGLNLAFTF